MDFKVGDKVRFLYEKGEGTITSIASPYKIRVELTEGLEIEVPASELVAIKHHITLKDIEINTGKVNAPKRKKTVSKPHARDELEIDLHIENLTDEYYNMTNAQKLSLQLDHFQNVLEGAIKGHIKKVVFIHGVGNGILRQSLRDILKRYDGLEFSDASYKKYGAGATEVRILSRSKAKN